MTQITGRVFDSSTYGWIADVAVNVTAGTYATKAYVDSADNLLWAYNAIQDASILALEASIGSGVTFAYIDGSLATRDASIAQNIIAIQIIDGSITSIEAYQTIQDASISALEASIGSGVTFAYIDGSLALRDVSIAWLDVNKLEASDLTPYALITYVDGSLATKADISDVYYKAYIDG